MNQQQNACTTCQKRESTLSLRSRPLKEQRETSSEKHATRKLTSPPRSLLFTPLLSSPQFVTPSSLLGSFFRVSEENCGLTSLLRPVLFPVPTEPCDDQRPCARCTRRGPKVADECRDSDRKPKKGMPRSRAARAAKAALGGSGGGEVAEPVLMTTAAAGFVERGGGGDGRSGGMILESNASSSAAMSRRAGLRGGGGLGQCSLSSLLPQLSRDLPANVREEKN